MSENGAVKEKAILVQLVTARQTNADEMLEELCGLAESAGLQVSGEVVQKRDTPDSRWLIGKGKVEELKHAVEQTSADTVIFGSELSPAQVRNLERAVDAKILDRTQLILDIFAQRAQTREGQIQVELAQLNYLLPRLSGHGIHLSRLGAGIGTRGPGETKLETDRRHIHRRIAELKRKLQDVVRHRSLYRERRKKQGIFQIALVGYTNAGKSTLLKQLTKASEVLAEDRLFATLDPTSRTLQLRSGNKVILTDTVGFIQDLPHDLVAAFRATLEEVNEADLILHVVDSSSDLRDSQIKVVEQVLAELGADSKETLLLYNKADIFRENQIEPPPLGKDAMFVSAFSPEDMALVKNEIQNRLLQQTATFTVPHGDGEVLSQLHQLGEIVDQQVDEHFVKVTARMHPSAYERMKHRLEAFRESE